MKRIVLIATAVAGLFTAGITTVATAATPHRQSTRVARLAHASAASTIHAKCSLPMTTVAPNGTLGVTPGTASGYQYGDASCSTLHKGTTRIDYTTADSGDLTGKIQHWFNGGTVYGTFTLTLSADNGPPTAASFTAASYAGTVKITGGKGSFAGDTGTGTLKCSTQDAIHFSCAEKLSISTASTALVATR